jgi:phage shock protein A
VNGAAPPLGVYQIRPWARQVEAKVPRPLRADCRLTLAGRGEYAPTIEQATRAVNISKEQAVMSLFSRAHDILAAKANKALDSAENPDETLDYSYEQMLDYITRVRQALVEIAAERKRIELQEPQLQHTIAHLGDQAQAALGQGREDLAREALSRKAAAQQQVDEMEAQHQELAEQEQKLQETLTQLQQRVSRFRSEKEVMKADYAVAQASDLGGTGDALVRAQDKIATMQARAGAMDELLQSGVLEDVGGHTDDIREELDEAAAAADVDSQLAALKAKLAASPATPELSSGDSPPANPARE